MSETLEKIASSARLTAENARFVLKGDLVCLFKKNEDGSESEFDRIVLVRNFPFEFTDKYITVLDRSAKEIGIIVELSDIAEGEREYLSRELERRYYMPKITRIDRMKEKMGFSSWTVLTDRGLVTFSIKDTYKNIIRLAGGRCILSDVDGNRYEIEDYRKLDKKSLKRIELVI